MVGGAVAQPDRWHRRATRRIQGAALSFIRVDSRFFPMRPGVPLSGTVSREYLWYIPNTVLSGHRGDDTVDGWGSLEYLILIAQRAMSHGWGGARIGAGRM